MSTKYTYGSESSSIGRKLYFRGLLDPEVRDTLLVCAVTVVLAVQLLRNAAEEFVVHLRRWADNDTTPLVSVVVPMRDEAGNVAGCIGSLLAQRYSRFEVIAVDDGSGDGTGALLAGLAQQDRRLKVLTGEPLPPGWTGKNWALAQGCAVARGDWLLCVDADTRHEPDCIASAVAYALREQVDMLTLLPRLELHSFWEKLLVPHSGELYSLLVGFLSQVNDPRSKVASANGQFILLRRAVYDAVGTQAALRGEVAEDRALALLVKSRGYLLRMAQGHALVRARVYAGLGELWGGFSKTLFPASGRSITKSALAVLALTLYGILPFCRLLIGLARLLAGRPAGRSLGLALAQVGPILVVRVAIARHLGLSPLYALTYPLAVLMGDGLVIWSAYRYLSGRGMSWKGRLYGAASPPGPGPTRRRARPGASSARPRRSCSAG